MAVPTFSVGVSKFWVMQFGLPVMLLLPEQELKGPKLYVCGIVVDTGMDATLLKVKLELEAFAVTVVPQGSPGPVTSIFTATEPKAALDVRVLLLLVADPDTVSQDPSNIS